MEDVRLECSGLYLDPSELTAPAGSLREALNVRIKRQNLVEPRPGFPPTAVAGASGGGRALFSWGGELYGVFGTELWHIGEPPAEVQTADDWPMAISSDSAFFAPMGRCGYVTTDNGVYRIATPGSSTAVLAGIPQGTVAAVALRSGVGLPNGEHLSMRTLFTDVVNQQLLVGAPSDAFLIANSSGSAKGLTLIIPLPDGVTAGMVVQLYGTDVVLVASDTGDEMTLMYTVEVESSDVTAGYVTLYALVTADERGASLYTNETQEGILQAAYPPPEAKCLAWWKNMAFYGDCSPLLGFQRVDMTRLVSGSATIKVGQVDITATGGTATLGSPIITGLVAAPFFRVGMYVSQAGDVGTADAVFPAFSRVITVGATTITIDKNALSSVGVTVLGHGVLTVDGEEFINGAISNVPDRQFGSRTDLVALIAAHTDVTLSISDYTATFYTMTWQSRATFDISYIGADDLTLEGLYGVTPVSASAVDPVRSRVAWSKTLQPEAVPLLQYQDIGDWRAPVMRLIPTRDSLFVLKSDGVWRITGDDPDSLRVEEFDRSLRLIHRRAADVFDNQVWAWTSNGVVAISEAGAQRMSEPAIGVALADSQENIITLGLSEPPGGVFITGCTNQECVLVGVPSSTATGANATAEYIYCWEGKTGAWVRWTPLTNIDWRGAVEHVGRMVLVGEDASLMYQDDDNSDAEAAVTVTLASATQATIAALGSDGVGCRITQGSVVAWLTAALGSAAYTTTATLTNDAATAAAPMTCVVEWNASPTPGTMSHWRQMRAQFSTLVQAWRVRFGFTSERVHTLAEVYQDFTAPQTDQGVTALRMFVTRAHSRCARLRPRLTIASAGQRWLLNGITLTFEPMRDGNRLP